MNSEERQLKKEKRLRMIEKCYGWILKRNVYIFAGIKILDDKFFSYLNFF